MLKKLAVNEIEYDIIKLLGKGKGGFSYLARDGTTQYVLKQIHHEPCDYYQFGNKIEAEKKDYERLIKTGILLPRMIAIDENEERILKEYIEGPTIYQLLLEHRMQDRYLSQMKDICKILYPLCINIDYFPTNFVVKQNQIYYIDYECNAYMDEWNFENWGIKYWTYTEELKKYISEHELQ